MEGYTFFDFFATKHIDYLLAVISLLFLIPFWKLLTAGKEFRLPQNKKDDYHRH